MGTVHTATTTIQTTLACRKIGLRVRANRSTWSGRIRSGLREWYRAQPADRLRTWSRDAQVVALSILVLYLMALVLARGPARIVLTDSMAPTLQAGDLVWIVDLRSPVSVGSIVTYQYDDMCVTHRVVARGGGYFVTQGDANASPDPWRVLPSQIIGEPAFRVPYVGRFVWFSQSRGAYLALMVVPSLVLLACRAACLVRPEF